MAHDMLVAFLQMDPLRYLVVGFDSSPFSELALFRALKMTEFSQFALVHVVSVLEAEDDFAILPNGLRLSSWSASETMRLTVTRLTEVSNRLGRFTRVVPHVRTGAPGPALVDFARRYQADMVVVGAQGIGASSKPLGSVTRHLLEELALPLRIEALPLDRTWAPTRSAHPASVLRSHDLLLSQKNVAPRVALN